MQLGATYPEISAVITASPSAYRYAGTRNNMPLPQPAWTLNNEALPYLKPKFDVSGTFRFFWNWITRRPSGNKAGFIKTLKDSAKSELPVFLVSECKDRSCSSRVATTSYGLHQSLLRS